MKRMSRGIRFESIDDDDVETGTVWGSMICARWKGSGEAADSRLDAERRDEGVRGGKGVYSARAR